GRSRAAPLLRVRPGAQALEQDRRHPRGQEEPRGRHPGARDRSGGAEGGEGERGRTRERAAAAAGRRGQDAPPRRLRRRRRRRRAGAAVFVGGYVVEVLRRSAMLRRLALRWLWVAALATLVMAVGGAGCAVTFDPDLGAGGEIACGADDSCPTDFVCAYDKK